MPLTGKQRRKLRALGHHLQVVVQVGHQGVTPAVVAATEQALFDHELIKVKIGSECPVDRHEVADRLDEEPGVDLVQMVGRVLLLYKRHPHTPRYEGKRSDAAKAAAAAAVEPPPAPGTSKRRRRR